MSFLRFLEYNTDWPVAKSIKQIKELYLADLVSNERTKFDFEYDKVMFEEKKKNIEEIKELIKEYQWKLQGVPERIAELEDLFERKKANYEQLEERYKHKRHIKYYTEAGRKLDSFLWDLRIFKNKRYDYVFNSKGRNFADQLEHRGYVQDRLMKQQMFKEFWRRIEEGQQLQEEMLAPSVEKAIRRYRATHG